MNKSDLIDAMAESAKISKAAAGQALDAFVSAVTQSLARQDTVTLVGFGSFHVKERQARIGRNPRTKEEIRIEASRYPSFKPGKTLKDAVR